MLRCVIVDDEEFSVDVLTTYISQLPEISSIKNYLNSQLALKDLLHGDKVDILFLDVDMPLITGIELAKALRSKAGKLIFTTSHSKYAFDAFEVEADAFLLKPFSFSKFSLTISRLFPNNIGHTANEYFFLKNKDEGLRIIKINYTDVIVFESFHNYVKVYLTNDRLVTAYLSMKDVSDLVRGRSSFQQLHRAYIINTDQINYIEGYSIKMSNKVSFTVGDRYKEHFSSYLSSNLAITSRKKG